MDYQTRTVYYHMAMLELAFHRLEKLPEYTIGKLRTVRYKLKQYAPEDHLQYRADLKARLDELQQDGMVPVYCWGRDCDQCESDSVTLIPATVTAYNRFEDRQFRYAEGPTQVYPISFEDYADFEPSFRDRRAEQYNY